MNGMQLVIWMVTVDAVVLLTAGALMLGRLNRRIRRLERLADMLEQAAERSEEKTAAD